MPRFSTVSDTWTDDTQCKRVPEGSRCVDANGVTVEKFAFAETESGLVGVIGDKVDPTRKLPWLEWRILTPPLTVQTQVANGDQPPAERPGDRPPDPGSPSRNAKAKNRVG